MRFLMLICPGVLLGFPLHTEAQPTKAEAPPQEYVIRGAALHRGDGAPAQIGDLHIKGDRVIAIGTVKPTAGAVEIDGKGLVVCPGFIDLHTHCDYGLLEKNGRRNPNYLRQGCTTVVTGNCGSGPVDVAAYFKKLEKNGIACNEIHLAPHNSIRAKVMGNVNRVPTQNEQAAMEQVVKQAMLDGAWGMSTGLIYNPGTYARTEEIIGLAKVVAKHGGIYASHMRNENSQVLVAIEETLTIGREGGLPVHISHIKASGRAAWGKSADAVALIEAARKKGQKVTADQYPYIASSTSLRATVVPTRFREGSSKEYVERLNDPRLLADWKSEVAKALKGRDGGKPIQIARYSKNPDWQGKNIAAIAEKERREPLDIVLEIERNGGAQIVNFSMNEEDVRVYMKQPWVATASDGGVQRPGATVPHPRNYGTFPRKIGRYGIDDGVLSLSQAIRSATGLPADILGLNDRGYLKVGYFADVVIFDPKTFRDTATFDKPHQFPNGLKWVFVNGEVVVSEGKQISEKLPGRVLRHPTKRMP